LAIANIQLTKNRSITKGQVFEATEEEVKQFLNENHILPAEKECPECDLLDVASKEPCSWLKYCCGPYVYRRDIGIRSRRLFPYTTKFILTKEQALKRPLDL
jgi:hypothetical protein